MSGDHNDSGAPADSADETERSPAASGEDETEAALPPRNEALEAAMAEAMAAVERREGDGEGSSSTTAQDAVTEALIKAKAELEHVLEQTQKEASQLRERWMRAAADLENYRRRAAREREDVQKFGIEKLLKDFLPVLDDLDRAIGAFTGQAAATKESEQLLGGVRLVQKKFVAALEKHGVTTFEAQGQPFNPEQHEAVQQAHAPVPSGAVAEELQRGFLIHDRLLRPAMVVVSLGPAEGEGTERSE